MKRNCQKNLKTCDIILGKVYNVRINYHCDLCKPQNNYYDIPICFYEDGVYSYQDCDKQIRP